MLVLSQESGPAFAERHGLAAAHLHLPHEEYPHPDQQQHREPLDQHGYVPRISLFRPDRDLHPLLTQGAHQVRIFWHEGLKTFFVTEFAVDRPALDDDFRHLPFFNCGEEVAKHLLRLFGLLTIEQVEQEEEHQS